MRDDQRRCWSSVPVSCCLSATGIRFLGHPLPAGGLGLPYGRLTGPHGPDPIGIPRSTRISCGRGGCPLYPGDGGALTADCSSPTATRRFPTTSPYPPVLLPSPGLHLTRHHRGFTCVHPSGLPQPVAPGWIGHPWAFPRSFTPHRYRRRMSGWGQALNTCLGLRSRQHQPTPLSASPLTACRFGSGPVGSIEKYWS